MTKTGSQSEKQRLDVAMAERKLVASRSQAESYVRLGKVTVNDKVVTKPAQPVSSQDEIFVVAGQQYVSRAALKLQSADKFFKLDFNGKTVLDVGSSTGGFTQYALLHGATKVIAVDVGTDQLHPALRGDPRIELHEKTDVRNLWQRSQDLIPVSREAKQQAVFIDAAINIAVCDVSFISLREILPHVSCLLTHDALLVAMVKPQFEAGHSAIKHKGVIKNDRMRREVLKDFEVWVQKKFRIIEKTDSGVAGSKGNIERFYKLQKLR